MEEHELGFIPYQPEEESIDKMPPPLPNQIQCSELGCTVTFGSNSSLRRHLKDKHQKQIGSHGSKSDTCVCGSSFSGRTSLSRHMKSCGVVKNLNLVNSNLKRAHYQRALNSSAQDMSYLLEDLSYTQSKLGFKEHEVDLSCIENESTLETGSTISRIQLNSHSNPQVLPLESCQSISNDHISHVTELELNDQIEPKSSLRQDLGEEANIQSNHIQQQQELTLDLSQFESPIVNSLPVQPIFAIEKVVRNAKPIITQADYQRGYYKTADDLFQCLHCFLYFTDLLVELKDHLKIDHQLKLAPGRPKKREQKKEVKEKPAFIPRCSYCKAQGHLSIHCQDNVCQVCDEPGHLPVYCPRREAIYALTGNMRHYRPFISMLLRDNGYQVLPYVVPGLTGVIKGFAHHSHQNTEEYVKIKKAKKLNIPITAASQVHSKIFNDTTTTLNDTFKKYRVQLTKGAKPEWKFQLYFWKETLQFVILSEAAHQAILKEDWSNTALQMGDTSIFNSIWRHLTSKTRREKDFRLFPDEIELYITLNDSYNLFELRFVGFCRRGWSHSLAFKVFQSPYVKPVEETKTQSKEKTKPNAIKFYRFRTQDNDPIVWDKPTHNLQLKYLKKLQSISKTKETRDRTGTIGDSCQKKHGNL